MAPHRRLAYALGVMCLLACTACGGSVPRAQQADLIRQPTPDPTLDAVVRDLPRALAGVAPTPTPTAAPVVVVPKPAAPKPAATVAPKPAVREPAPKPTEKPALRAPSPVPTQPRR
jgi:hypothetical protein